MELAGDRKYALGPDPWPRVPPRVEVPPGPIDTHAVDRVLAAGTRGELDDLLSDLPTTPPRSEPPTLVLRTTNGSVRQTGSWVVPEEIVARCGVGRIRIDFTDATR